MASEEGAEFSLPSIPYFYHDIIARIIPGLIQLGLIAALATYHSAEWVQKLKLKAVLDASHLAAVLMLLAAAYFVGVFFEGWMLLGLGVVRGRILRLYHFAFSSALMSIRRDLNITGNIDDEEAARLAEETSSIIESYEPLVPHFFARATRFLAEAKMMLYSALAMPTAVVVVGATTGHWWPPGGCTGIAGGLVLFVLFVAVSFARQRRRATEILRCVRYLALRTEPVDACQRAHTAWTRVLASSSKAAPE
jgi:hypothetical protein